VSDFDLFKAAVSLLAASSAQANSPEQLIEALIARQNNPFHDLDFWAYASRLQNAIHEGLDAAMNILGATGEEQ